MRSIIRVMVILLIALPFTKCEGQSVEPILRIVDDATDRPIEHVHIRDLSTPQLYLTDPKGELIMKGIMFPAQLELTHVSYEPRHLTLLKKDMGIEGSLEVRLIPLVIMLDPVDVRQAGPEMVYNRDDLHVGAFHVNGPNVWVLVYETQGYWHRQENAGEQVLRGARLHLLDTLFNELASMPFPSQVKALHHDHRGAPIVETAGMAWRVEVRKGKIVLEQLDLDLLHNAILPWRDSIPGALLGSDRVDHYPAFDHLAFDPVDNKVITICTVEDPHVMQLFRSQYKYMSGRDKVLAMDMERASGIDREVIAGYMTGFHHDIYFSVPYAPLFVVNDTICVFDHSIELIRKFDLRMDPVGETPITHQRDRRWKKKLLQDLMDGTIWSVHVRNSEMQLWRIDPRTGNIVTIHKLSHPWPEEVQVHGGYAYYVYRPYGSLQRRTLYREKLP